MNNLYIAPLNEVEDVTDNAINLLNGSVFEFDNSIKDGEDMLELLDNMNVDVSEFDNGLTLKRFKLDGCLYQYLLDWYGRREGLSPDKVNANMEEGIRNFTLSGGYVYFNTGLGYDYISDDLLNLISYDARRYFENVFVYGKSDDEFEKARKETNLL